ncbi:unnamed protein product [Callosobruchus maculatus]|uniref:Uncharacterized protein n=1 Tax=Callosobruchus maculatus TaxID=64391 RepID=A0A653C4H7_CALMS|nr:unnamed protein product [Callosobruchus maculatus]
MDEPVTVKKEVLIKTEASERPEEQNENHSTNIQLEEEGEVHTVVLQNLQFADEQSEVVLNHFSADDSDGNLQIDTLEEDEVVHAYIIENDEYENLEGHEIIYQTVQEDGTTVQYIIAEEEEGEEVYEQVEQLDETENEQQMEYTYEYEQVEMVDHNETAEEEDSQILQEEVVDMSHEEHNGEDTVEVEEPPEEVEEKPQLLVVKEEVFTCEYCGKSLKTAVVSRLCFPL